VSRSRTVGCVVAGAFSTGWLSVVTLVLLPFLGFATADHRGTRSPLVGAVAGVTTLLILLGMTPAHGRVPDLSEATLVFGSLGAGPGAGFVGGGLFGSVGGFGAHVARREFGS
jgi:hypothetical protein